ncbi:hypothetical protein J3D55_003941 [Chryseobacterium ginsenosidimutans]|uniref:hypothetical protein n=1 Tax=Chryseobacterium ginsenosidimutans TaxID=687846 RepID=UPI002169455A|nr:hypothetical protein [Chryseobacterium ginsenosidimutans]MCS3871025.1 hypothetical protein [Chryseobacterium ginsenosidimutans]
MEAIFYFILFVALLFIGFYFKDDLRSSKRLKISRHVNGRYPFYFTPKKPVKWFDFTGLINSFRMVSLSADILSIIDKREVQTAMGKDKGNELTCNDFNTSEDEFWFDFIADTGDGFDSTTTVFYHVTRDSYSYSFKNPEHQNNQEETEITLKKGSALVVGGDLVYPVGSEANYRDRFKGPLRFVAPDTGKSGPVLIATPGNHDWYDGLSAFFRLMCQQGKIGNYRTVQNRSYFAYELRDHVHLFGIDNQLLGDIDIPQMTFFTDYVKKISEKNPKNHVILLIAEPYWYNYDINDRYKRKQRMDSLEYIIRTLTVAVKNLEAKNIISEIIFEVVLTGDIHHYANYKLEEDGEKFDNEVKHFITSGGGGAFGHVTDFLKEKITIPVLQNAKTTGLNYKLDEVYPSKEKSCKKVFWNLIFFIINYEFTTLMLLFSFISTYIFCSTDSIIKKLILFLLPSILSLIISKVTNHECSSKEKWISGMLRAVLFTCSFAIQLFILFLLPKYYGAKLEFLSDNTLQFLDIDGIKNFLGIFLVHKYFLFQWIVSGILQSALFGLYIFFGYFVFKLYVTEVSSAKVNKGNKNFLKFKITDTEIVIYVIAIKKAYKWMNLLKKKNAGSIQKEMLAKDPKRFVRDNFKPDPDNNVRIIDKITIKL